MKEPWCAGDTDDDVVETHAGEDGHAVPRGLAVKGDGARRPAAR